MRMEELDAVCRQAARDLLARQGRPLRPAVVLPLPDATRVASLPGFPDDDPARFDLLAAFARDRMRPANAPAYGFLAEAAWDTGSGPVDVVVAVCGARGHAPRVTAAPVRAGDDGEPTLGDFVEPEPLDPTAFPFLSPLQHAADAAAPVGPGGTGGTEGPEGPGDLPIVPT